MLQSSPSLAAIFLLFRAVFPKLLLFHTTASVHQLLRVQFQGFHVDVDYFCNMESSIAVLQKYLLCLSLHYAHLSLNVRL